MIIADAQVEVNWPQQQGVPLGGWYDVFGDGKTGSVNYSSPLNADKIEAWPDDEAKIGAGLGRAGMGVAGYGDGGMGAGLGGAGLGMAGFGAEVMTYTTPELADGTHKLAVVGFDPAGNAVTPADLEEEIAVAGVPEPPGVPEATAYDNGSDTLTLGWALSADDNN